ncbi:TetR/AcrR family transcriptional regulator [Streptococcus tangpeifui]|uniref:TetR/AcrR family transcriptional regulator n=1 Tax=Streptococcus tangpeifui TaxID=2709400 RepID=UPI0013EAAE66|nr:MULTISPECIES: TetR/AcrR family transcriptional regulator [unclassified Streptococcus]
MVQGSRESIINAVFRIASKNPDKSKLTMTEIAKEAGMSRQAIYQKHFSSVDEIFDYIHTSMTEEVFKTFKRSIADPSIHSIYEAVARDVIPKVYQKRIQARILYHTSIDRNVFNFLEESYLQLLLEADNIHIINNSPLMTPSMIKIVINYIFALVGEWVAEDFPEPPEVFAKTFLTLMETAPKGLVDAKPKINKS